MALRRTNRGVTLVEVIIAVAVLVLALLGLFASIAFATRANRVNRESTQAMQACQRAIEEMQLVRFSEIFATFDADGANDPAGPNTASGNQFNVLDDGSILFGIPNPGSGQFPLFGPISGQTFVGLIEFPQNGNLLVETQPVGNTNGLGDRDLNGDGVLAGSGTDMATSYDILPVAVTIRWAGTGGDRTVTYRTVLILR